MPPTERKSARRIVAAAWAALLLAAAAGAAADRPLTFEDLMRFKTISHPVISEGGGVVAYNADPDRGDGGVVVHVLANAKRYEIPLGSRPVISSDGRWVAATLEPGFAEREAAGDRKDDVKRGMALLDVTSGRIVRAERVERFAFSDDARWLAILHAPAEKAEAGKNGKKKGGTGRRKGQPTVGGVLTLRELLPARETEIPDVAGFTFDPASSVLVTAVAVPGGTGNALTVRRLADTALAATTVAESEHGRWGGFAWPRHGTTLAYLAAVEDGHGTAGPAELWVWDPATGKARRAAGAASGGNGWTLPFGDNEVAWSRDGSLLFFGFKPEAMVEAEAAAARKDGEEAGNKDDTSGKAADPYDVKAILDEAAVDVWHSEDPVINPQQKKMWKREVKQTYLAVFHPDTGAVVRLADEDLPQVSIPVNPRLALATSDIPYRKETTWNGRYHDLYVVSLADGARTKLATHLTGRGATLSPDGRFVAYFDKGGWHLFATATGETRDLTAALGVPFDDVDHDTPSPAPAYGAAGWVGDGEAVLLYDQYDVWQVPTVRGEPVMLTAGEGRKTDVTFRVVAQDPEAPSFAGGEPLLLTAYHNDAKNYGFYAAVTGRAGVRRLIDEKKHFRFVARAKHADRILYTRESYTEFPDLWVTDAAFGSPRKISDLGRQTDGFGWGSAELVHWASMDGTPLDGVLIKPAGYAPGTRVPVVVYFYERMSQRLYDFNEPVVNHRPSFPLYAGAGYAIFLPDVVFETGRPGLSAMKCVVPGVQKLVDMGVADPKAVGLHGHSWGGYETAYMVTQTDMFAAAIAGAPVSNMTSAYGGIRWGSGMARQFQYERTQSRIGGSLWEYPLRYIENSPLFFADYVHTPLLIEFGDEDDAVPWYQGIELYLALRRLGKSCIMLEYRNEPHHVKRYADKLDYAIRMKEYLDHYLKGAPAPAWMTEGVPYRGK